MAVQLDVGSWGLFTGVSGKQLVLVDDEPCGPISARKITRAIPRRLLLDEQRVTRAFEAHTGPEAIPDAISVTHEGAEWTIKFRPVLSPRTSTLVGLLAAVSPADEVLPEPPLIGSWEWEIERDADGNPTPHRRTFWDRNLFHLYDVAPDVAQQKAGYWEVGIWANELIDQTDQMRVSSSVRDGIQDGISGVRGTLRCLTYNVVTGYGSERRGRRHLRLVGQVPTDQPADKLILQGFSYAAPETFHDMAFEQDAARVDDVLRGVMDLAGEPMAVLDPSTLDVLMTSPAWRRQDFGHVGGLGEIAADDPAQIQEFITAAVNGDTSTSRSAEVRIRRQDGSIQNARITVTAVRVRASHGGYDALLKMDF